ncbi:MULTISPECIES: cysteine desulfurase family protein [Brevundimonas]|jgi:cysteine desulfurase|uniref:Cysteine desulfurase n=1 Tax=Brevundimonas mediterranea TaxID=74329 RepID=A0AB37E971_9CAUL|nr:MULTISPECIES: cysteine desulfurase family protein [Brevundimonas]EDX80529.1 aminotransferase, class V superfamily [Brevundimonas sp. BAL3]MBA4332759.1 cysteine desulfurase [Brevundimonas sp.]MDZ4362511.1 cysteine desulfurase family protein [Brevundimonas sp.]QIH73948.1 cysteine desulfurase [Brevundimonas mediterranea]
MSAIYLDYNASGLVRPEVLEIMTRALADNGNPSAVHAAGRRARARVETARAQVGELVGADPTAVVFNSGGTEANAQAIASALAAGCERLIVSATEHPCVAEAAANAGAPVEVLPVDANGVVDLDWLAQALARPGRAVVAVHHANNESGVIQPVVEAAALVRAAGGWLHVDAIQSAGKIPVDMRVLDADSLTLSAHKLGGPQGVGALILKEGVSGVRILHGAGQERGLRAGTENVPGIAGFGVAADCAARDLKTMASHVGWRDSAEARVKAAGATVIGADVARLPNTLFMAVEGWDSPQQLIILDLAGVMVSAGSACSSGKVKPSKTISAMGLNALATGGVRVSGGWGTTESDWVRFADAWIAAYDKHKTRAAARVREVA